MTLEQYNEVLGEATKRWREYCNMTGNHPIVDTVRKEDYLEYWIAAVAFEHGRNDKTGW